MIQILGLRPAAQSPTQLKEVFGERGWRLINARDIFDHEKRTRLLETIPVEERVNLFWTVAVCREETGRKLASQDCIPFDIDGLNFHPDLNETQIQEHSLEVAKAAIAGMGLDIASCAILFSGHGAQFFIYLDKPFISEKEFNARRKAYGNLCDKANAKLRECGLAGKMDKKVWGKARIMRLPDTLNDKIDKPKRTARVLQEPNETLYNIDDILVKDDTKDFDQKTVNQNYLKHFPPPDIEAVQSKCAFIRFTKEHPEKVVEPQWYAMLSVIGNLKGGKELAHEYSKGHPGYHHYDTEVKLEQALQQSGPRTCRDISSMFEGCQACPYFPELKSPILLKGEKYFAHIETGWREQRIGKNGVQDGPPDYEGLQRKMALEHHYKYVTDTDQYVIYTGKHWKFLKKMEMQKLSADILLPTLTANEANELHNMLKQKNHTTLSELRSTAAGKLCFDNCVLDLLTGAQLPHSPEYGFFNNLPYDYDPNAKAPRFELFLKEIMGCDENKIEGLKQFLGYAISGDDCHIHTALLCLGTGANGKSVLFKTMAVLGGEFASEVSLQGLQQATSRHKLVNAYFNLSEETSVDAFKDPELFKQLVGGGAIEIKQLYIQPYTINNRAKILIAANTLPKITDATKGFLRRTFVVQFDQVFEGPNRDSRLFEKLKEEIPGICNSLLAAYRRRLSLDEFTGESESKHVIKEEQESLNAARDPVPEFVARHVEFKEGVFTTVSELYNAYRGFCQENGYAVTNSNMFGRQLKKYTGYISKEKSVKGHTARAYFGVEIKKNF